MKWFKHLSGALNDDMMFEAIEKFGSDAYLVFFGSMEMMADGFDVNNPGICRISTKKLTKNMQISRQKLVRILAFFDEKAHEKLTENKSFFATVKGEYVLFKCTRLAELCDEHTKRILRETPESVRSNSGVTPYVEEEVEERIKEKEKAFAARPEEKAPAPRPGGNGERTSKQAVSEIRRLIKFKEFDPNGVFYLRFNLGKVPPDPIRDQVLKELPCPNDNWQRREWWEKFEARYIELESQAQQNNA